MTHKHSSACSHEHSHENCNHNPNVTGKCQCGHNHSHEAETMQCSETKTEVQSHSHGHCCGEDDSDDPDDDHHHIHSDGCGCGHEHSHDKPIAQKDIGLFIASVIAFITALLIPSELIKDILFIASALFAGYDLFWNGLKMLFRFKFEENVLLLIAVVASFILGEFPEACLVTILFKLGGFLESTAISRSKKSMEKLTQIRPDYAYIKDPNGAIVSVEAKNIAVGEEVYLRAGDRVAIDCEIIDGSSSVDASALTGESVPITVEQGDELLSGSINLSGLLRCRTTKSFANSTASQIIETVYQSSAKKGKTEGFISRFAKVYTPIVIILAILIAVIPPLLGIGTFHDFIMRSLIFLVASCPCALVISVPLSFFASIGAVSKHGVLVKGSMYIEKLSKIKAIAFDKTGTLTKGSLAVDSVVSLNGISEQELLAIASGMEQNSSHPIAKAIMAHAKSIAPISLENMTELAGLGMKAEYQSKEILCGGKNLLLRYSIDISELPPANVYVCIDNAVVGYITVKEEINPDSFTIKEKLSKQGIERLIMLTGDNETSAKAVAEQCRIDEIYAGLLPNDKVAKVEMLKESGNKVAFVGDGINDAPVLTVADLGISMGLGSEIANVSSDVILAGNKLSSLSKAIELAKRSMNVVYFNIYFALMIKAVVLVLGAIGYGSMWLAVFADIGVTILTVLNAIRLLKVKKY